MTPSVLIPIIQLMLIQIMNLSSATKVILSVGIIYKVKISDLDFSFKSDSCVDDTQHISWICKKRDGDNQNCCISAEFTDVEGKKETQSQESVYVLFSNKNQICSKLKSAFEQLFAHIMESCSK